MALYEAGADASFIEVDAKTKRTEAGADYRAIHPLGLVPALEIEGGEVVTESAAILQLIAERSPQAELARRDPLGRARLQQWLSFIGTELHKALYVPLLDKAAPAEVKAYARAKADARLGWVAERLAAREFLLDRFSVADAYPFAVLNWSSVTPVDMKRWPALPAYHAPPPGAPRRRARLRRGAGALPPGARAARQGRACQRGGRCGRPESVSQLSRPSRRPGSACRADRASCLCR
ncbi:glutathione S-transferase N-terminal domain-containing protein [Sorangium sp. So ce1151]